MKKVYKWTDQPTVWRGYDGFVGEPDSQYWIGLGLFYAEKMKFDKNVWLIVKPKELCLSQFPTKKKNQSF